MPVTWLMFSLRQHDNFLWDWQIVFFITTFAFLLTVVLLDASNTLDRYFSCSLPSGIVASFSSANGLLVWPIGFLQIWGRCQPQIQESEKGLRNVLWVWGLTGACAYAPYFAGYTKPPHHPRRLHFVSEPIFALSYFFAVLGSPFYTQTPRRYGSWRKFWKRGK